MPTETATATNRLNNILMMVKKMPARQQKDNYLFDLAYQSNSKYLVSGDRDVRETPITKPLEVVSLTKFKEVIRA